MSWRGSTHQSIPINTTLAFPFSSSSSQPSPPWEEGTSRGLSVQGEVWAGYKTQSLPDHFVLGADDKLCHMSPILTVCLVACYCLMMVLGLAGNAGLICIISRGRERVNVTSIFICNLSFSDILVCIFCLPFTVTYTLMDHWVFGPMLCRLVPFIQCVSVTVSVLSLVFIALERHQLIVHPSGWKPNIPQAYTAVLVIWVLACVTSLPFLAFQLLTNEPYSNVSQPQPPRHRASYPDLLHPNTSLLSTHSNSGHLNRHQAFPDIQASAHLETCLEHWPSQQQKLAYTTWLLLFQYCGPLLVVLFCYIRVFVRLRHRKEILDRARTPEKKQITNSQRINIMLVSLITAFALCWLPLTIFNAVSDWNQEALPVCHHNLLFSLCHLLAMLSTCINPVIYGFLNSNFRQEVREAFLNCRSRPVAEDYNHFPLSNVHIDVSHTSIPINSASNSV